ncbi:sulfatase family protein [Paludibaculum fermentans]|uniref:Sulfatase n=1 Tax=Paludibaculum fermentans TaxID=1473598 RepID=A0A7S7NU23_PALFE|nr:sulfatase [Paludibaculum fermentans]QOY89787.1 sulfatase [Paludibaculum fermentans]
MNRREFLSTSAAQALAPTRRPNVLYLHSHDTGRYVQPYGHPVATPNLQKFAEQGVLFRRAYSGAPTCSPSRAALLTGQTAHGSGMLGLAHRGFSLSHPERHLANFLQAHGYETTLCNVQHETKAGTVPTLGYQRVLKTASNRGPDAAAAAVEYLNSKPKAPFFLSCGFFETHREFPVAGLKEDARYTLPPAPLPDTPQVRQDMANFKAAARVLDGSMGSILEALARNGLEDNTLVVLTTDHGIAFPAMKCNLTDHGIGVMLMMRGPGGFLGGKVSDAMVSHLDVYPTLCETLELPTPAWLEGRSLTPLVKGAANSIRDEIFAEVSYHASYEPKRALRTARYKYIRNFGDRKLPVLPNCDDGYSKSYWLEQGWKDRYVPREELYDLVFDTNETNNLVAHQMVPAPLEELRGRLDRWMKDTDDPLLRGPVAAPHGAQVNDPAGLSPREPVIVVP